MNNDQILKLESQLKKMWVARNRSRRGSPRYNEIESKCLKIANVIRKYRVSQGYTEDSASRSLEVLYNESGAWQYE